MLNRGLVALGLAALLAGSSCSSGGDNAQSTVPGFGSDFTIAGFFYARLVDVYDEDNTLVASSVPVSPSLTSDSTYTLSSNAVTGGESLTINAKSGTTAFEEFLRLTRENSAGGITLPVIQDAGPGDPSVSFCARNAGVVVQFTKDVNPDTVNDNTFQVQTGTAQSTSPFTFVGTKTEGIYSVLDNLVTFTPVVNNQQNIQTGKGVNSLGFPPSLSTTDINVRFKFPVALDAIAGINAVIEDTDGQKLAVIDNNTPVDIASTAEDESAAIEQRFRSGGDFDPNSGFLEDSTAPRVLGAQQVSIASVSSTATNTEAVTLSFTNASSCSFAFQSGDVLLQGANLGEVLSLDSTSGDDRTYTVSLLNGNFSAGLATYKTAYDENLHGSQKLCFVTFSPPLDTEGDVTTLDSDASFIVEFSEPVKSTTTGFSRFLVVTNRDLDSDNPKDGVPDETGGVIEDLTQPASGDSSDPTIRGASFYNFVVTDIQRSSDLKSYELIPLSPLADQGLDDDGSTLYTKIYDLHIVSGTSGVVDLAGNALGQMTENFRLEGIQVTDTDTGTRDQASEGITFRWISANMDEDGDTADQETNAANQGLGQGVFDSTGGGIDGRDATVYRRVMDNTNTFVKLMPITPGALQTPLAPLGARLMILARYHDIFSGQVPAGEVGPTGPSIADRDAWDVNVCGLNWAPFGGNLLPDIFGRITLNLGHAYYAPIARVDQPANDTAPWQNTGFNAAKAKWQDFKDQVLESMPNGKITESGTTVKVGMKQDLHTAFDTEYVIVSSNVFKMGNNIYTPWPEFTDKGFVYRDRTMVETRQNPANNNFRNPPPPAPAKGADCNFIDPDGSGNSGHATGIPFMGGGTLSGGADGFDSTEFQKAQISRNNIYRYSGSGTDPKRQAPSIGLPLLMEFKTYNTDQTGEGTLGINGFSTSFAFNTNQTGSPNPPPTMNILPAFRCYSQGFFNPTSGAVQLIDPDNEPVPRGGFSPAANSTTAPFDPTVYWKTYELQNCRTLFFSRWHDTRVSNPTYDGIEIEPDAADLPAGTSIIVEFRGAEDIIDFDGTGNTAKDDARILDPYGNCDCPNTNNFWTCDMTHVQQITDWTTDITSLSDRDLQWIQVRFRLQCDQQSAVAPSIDSLGISYKQTPP